VNAELRRQLPPGPRQPAVWQTIATWSRPTGQLERARARYGRRFTLRVIGQPPFVILSDPEDIKQVFMASPDVLHPGEGARILQPIVGDYSVILLDEEPHLEQRKLMLPAFHGERMQGLSGLMEDLAERELARWPRDEPIELHPRLQNVTLEIILRVVFGLEQGEQLDALRGLLTELLAFSESPISLLPFAQRSFFGRGRWARFVRLRAEVDRRLFELIEERRAAAERHAGDAGSANGHSGANGHSAGDGQSSGRGHDEDVLGMLLGARHEDGSPMSAQELRDELMTALVAGHETTASQLAWTFERLAREPAVTARLVAELDGDADAGDAYLTATVQEALRHRPVLPNAEPRLVKREIEIGGVTYPPGAVLFANAYLLHHDPEIYPQPYAFRPERFLEQPPGTYTWIPFGGGRRRCLGASFALLEMKVVLSAVLGACEVAPADARPERARRRSITISPAGQARVILRDRPRAVGRSQVSSESARSMYGPSSSAIEEAVMPAGATGSVA
jgi:cytochrome P450